MSQDCIDLQDDFKEIIKIEPVPSEVGVFNQDAPKVDTLHEDIPVKMPTTEVDIEDVVARNVVRKDDNRYTLMKLRNRTVRQCNICKDTFQRTSNFKKHYMCHSNSFPFVCELCGHKARECYRLRDHMYQKHNIEVTTAELRKRSGEPRRSSSNLNLSADNGYIILGTDTTKRYRCKICKKVLKSLRNFQLHFLLHSGQQSSLCYHCGHKCVHRHHLWKHLKMKHNIIEDDYRQYLKEKQLNRPGYCETCKPHTADKCTGAHIFYRKNRSNLCCICNYSCRLPQTLVEHVYLKHFEKHTSNLGTIEHSTFDDTARRYTCKFCKKPFCYEDFERHMLLHVGVLKFTCPHCDYQTCICRLLPEHLKLKHTNTQRQGFHQLGVTSEAPSEIEDANIVNNKQVNTVEESSMTTSRQPTDVREVIVDGDKDSSAQGDEQQKENFYDEVQVDGLVKGYQCRSCRMFIRQKEMMERHTLKHIGGCPFTCSHCQRGFLRKASLQDHLKRQHDIHVHIKDILKNPKTKPDALNEDRTLYEIIKDGDVTAFRCKLCSKTTIARYLMDRHLWQHTGEFPLTCSLCDAKVRLKKSMRCHLKNEHKIYVDLKDIRRDGSLKTDIRYGNLVSEGSTGTETTESTVQGRNTTAVGGTSKTTTRDSQDVAESFRPNGITADGNSKDFPKGKNRYAVIRRSGSKIFKCVVCGKELAGKYVFNAHYRIHTGKEPYSCSVCNHRARSKKVIANHIRRHHKIHIKLRDIPNLSTDEDSETNEDGGKLDYLVITEGTKKQFQCTLCGRLFAKKGSFDLHYIRHKRAEMFLCTICDHATKTKMLLQWHMKMLHNVDVTLIDASGDEGKAPHSTGNTEHIDSETQLLHPMYIKEEAEVDDVEAV